MGKGAAAALWLVSCCLVVAAIWAVERNRRMAELTSESLRLHAEISQRVDQHDAHLTSLSAIAIASAGERPELFREVALAIMAFYPRITRILLVPLDPARATLDVGSGELALDAAVRLAVRESSGRPVVRPVASASPGYMMVKRSPNTDNPVYGLALVIDAARLLGDDTGFWNDAATDRRLAMPDGTPLFTGRAPAGTEKFSRVLSSETQPLRLETAISVDAGSLLPPGLIALAIAAATLAVLALRAVSRQRAQVAAAEKRAEMSGLETRLSHASRVNALGEMASGMAHELTQPLTAILAQSQAARRLAARGHTSRLESVLEEVIGQTKRASAILERLRTWTRPQQNSLEAIDVRDCINVASALLARRAEEAGAVVSLDLAKEPLPVLADRIEIEQVIFNLVKNALDAVATIDGERRVIVAAFVDADDIVVDVSDSGPGISEAVREKLFTPFMTTRENGTGPDWS
jgi:C4-dicarboxylate-specific signal transduction histidine kinase